MKRTLCIILVIAISLSLIVYMNSLYSASTDVIDNAPENIDLVICSESEYARYILNAIKNDEYSKITKEVLYTAATYDPAADNIRGNALDGISYNSSADELTDGSFGNLKKYIINLFGENAWDNANFDIKNAIGPNAVSGYVDLRDGAVLNETEYAKRSEQYWNKIFEQNGIDFETIDPFSLEIHQLTEKYLDQAPFEFQTVPAEGDYLVTLTFNGYSIAATGEGPFRFFITKTTDGYKLYQSIYRVRAEMSNPDELIALDELEIAPLTDNSEILTVEENTVVREFIGEIGRTDASVHAMHLDCVNSPDHISQIWIDSRDDSEVTKSEAKSINDDFIINECSKIGIDYVGSNYGQYLTSDELEKMSRNKISPYYYPVKSFSIKNNPYTLIKVVLFDESDNDILAKYDSFYISDQDGEFKVITQVINEHIYDCAISLEHIGD